MRLSSPSPYDDVDERLHRAARDGDVVAIPKLLSEGLDINSVNLIGDTPLHLAVAAGRKEVIECLIGYGADINCQAGGEDWQDDTPLGQVAASCSIEFAEYLLQLGADPMCSGWMGNTPVDRAMDRKDPPRESVYELFLEHVKRGHH